ncbi:hypothetical protein SAMN05421770_103283 [Granulicella rosea]|uniref:Sigma E regulatory protein, MucB/RseB n=1 Tax=Granulicella rosea TaxID=474952 RepID=A0A239IU71_9BACT|nr:hypothetical protein [Granulicella rosea]SNS97127.1 hypothetical protein SAMN05421770_103283 [Granulicella rosea]
MRRHPRTPFRTLAGLVLMLGSALRAPSQMTPEAAHDLIAQAAKHELEIIQFNGVFVRYRVHIVNGHGDQYRDVIESKDGTVARLIFKEGRPLTPEEDQAEHERLKAMIDSPAAFAKHVRGDVTGKKLAVDLVSLMPDAMTYTWVPGQPQFPMPGSSSGQVVLDFVPNPRWHPPTMTSEALTGLRGRVWIDPQSHRMLRLDADIFQGVNFGWGMLAHIYPGGHVILEQTDVAAAGSPNQRWIFSHFIQHVTVRALMVKTVRENSEIAASGFQVIPSMPYPDAIRLLLATPLPAKLQ